MYKNEDINIIRDTILKEINPFQILLFGSYATGKQNEDSDIDLMILVKQKITRKEKLNILFKLEKRFLKLKYDIDIILKNWTEFNRYKKYIGTINYDVSREGKIIWTKI
ncbi:MAG: nucleotidyltransferase domain-containing protein [Candidatus Cloacimonadota bacterium]|nr:nucleotidyltransferase domain-containing protein [Candidatus Cloacimonadota bacterium]